MTLDEEVDLCVDMLLFINRKELQGESEVGVRLERSDDNKSWTIDFRDFNDETIHLNSADTLADAIHHAVGELRSKLMDESNEAMKLLERSADFKYAVAGSPER